METYELFFAYDFGGDDAEAWRLAVARYMSRMRERGTAVVAAVVSPTFGPGYEVWATTTHDPETSTTQRVLPNGVYCTMTGPTEVVMVIPWIDR